MRSRTRQDRLAASFFFLIGVPATLAVPVLCALLLYKAFPQLPHGLGPLAWNGALVALLAIVLSAPLGIGTALFASEFLRPHRRRPVGVLLEGLGALPPVCCAWFGTILLADSWQALCWDLGLLLVLAPFLLALLATLWPHLPPSYLDRLLGLPLAFLAGSALLGLAGLLHLLPRPPLTFLPSLHSPLGAAVAISAFLAPKVAARSLAILAALPAQLREASIACGATRWETTQRVVLPQSRTSLLLVLLELFAWAFGETMVVLVLCGSPARPPWNGATLSTALAVGLPDTLPGSAPERDLVWCALVLLAVSIAAQIPNRLREARP